MFEQSRGVKRGREQDSDPMLDRHGNAATPKLFVNKLPYNITEQEISDLFSKSDGYLSVQLGNKVLMAGEFRTCVVAFGSSEQAAAARVALQHHQAEGWPNPMLINFVKQDTRDSQQYLSHTQSGDTSLETDTLGNHACATIFVKNFAPELTQDKVHKLFPKCTKVALGNKQLRPGEFRTGYITFEDTAGAIAARKAMTGHRDDVQQVPLVIYYSVRPQDQTKPNGYSGEPSMGFPSSSPQFAPGSPVHGPSFTPSFSSPFPASSFHSSFAAPAFNPSFPSSSFSSPYATTIGALNPYSTLPALYAAGFPDPYIQGLGPNPFHTRIAPPSPGDEGRYSISDLFDSKGNAATNGLFVDCLPHDIRENQIHAIFSRTLGFKGLHMGTKALLPNEFRTAVVHYNSTENALRARAKLQHYREQGWARPLIIHYAKR